MPGDPEAKSTPTPRHGDTGVSIHVEEINRLQAHRDRLRHHLEELLVAAGTVDDSALRAVVQRIRRSLRGSLVDRRLRERGL